MKSENQQAFPKPKSLAHDDWRCTYCPVHFEYLENDEREIIGYELDWFYIDEEQP